MSEEFVLRTATYISRRGITGERIVELIPQATKLADGVKPTLVTVAARTLAVIGEEYGVAGALFRPRGILLTCAKGQAQDEIQFHWE